MKKYLFLVASVALMAAATISTSCSKDDNNGGLVPTIQGVITQILNVENAQLVEGLLPNATTANPGITINTNGSALAGGGNILNISSPEPLKALQISVEGMSGYLECIPTLVTPASARNAEQSTSNIYEYVVEIMYGLGLSNDIQINVNAVTENDDIISLLRQEAIDYVESQKGDLAINLVFDQAKDVDLHLYTPNGDHLYYGNRSIEYGYGESIEAFERQYMVKAMELAAKYGIQFDEDGEPIITESNFMSVLQYLTELEAWYEANFPNLDDIVNGAGLDHDSNAGCSIDNLNNENIVLNAEYLEPGTYSIYINMYENCEPQVKETNWTVMARLVDQIITPDKGQNPCSGKFAIDEPSNYDNDEGMTLAMTFTLTQEQINALKPAHVQGRKPTCILRAPLTDSAIMKLMDANRFTPKHVPAAIRLVK